MVDRPISKILKKALSSHNISLFAEYLLNGSKEEIRGLIYCMQDNYELSVFVNHKVASIKKLSGFYPEWEEALARLSYIKMSVDLEEDSDEKDSGEDEGAYNKNETDQDIVQQEQKINAKDLPLDPILAKIAAKENPVLRMWMGGQYKCKNLRRFVNEYSDITSINPTKNLIRDYLVKEDGEKFKESGVITTLNTYGVTPEKKKIENRHRKGTHKNNSL